jgi:hypothetical protein
MVDVVRDRGRSADDADLAAAARTHRVRMRIAFVESDRVELANIGVCGDMVACEVAVEDRIFLRIFFAFYDDPVALRRRQSSRGREGAPLSGAARAHHA